MRVATASKKECGTHGAHYAGWERDCKSGAVRIHRSDEHGEAIHDIVGTQGNGRSDNEILKKREDRKDA